MDEKNSELAFDCEQPLNILYLSQYFYPEQFLNNHIAKALVDARHRVDVVSCVPNYPGGRFFDGYSNNQRQEEIWQGVHIYRSFTVARGRSAIQLIANYIVYPISASWRILKLQKKIRYDVSFVSMPSPLFQGLAGIFAKRFFGIPTIFWVQDIWPDSAIITLKLKNRLIVQFLNRFCGWIYRQADVVMVQSDGFHAKIAGFGVEPSRIVTLPNSAPESFEPISVEAIPDRIRNLIPEGPRVIMFAGNIGESQDFDTIIAAAAMIPNNIDLEIVVIGSGRDEVRIKEKIAQEGVGGRFRFLGRHPECDMPAFFACADALLVSLRDEPIFALTVPSKVQAYMACGKAILASLAGEGAKIVEQSKTGFVVSPQSPKELSLAMITIACIDQSTLDNMGQHARSAYEDKFALRPVVQKLLTWMKQTSSRGKER